MNQLADSLSWDWQTVTSKAVTDLTELSQHLSINPQALANIASANDFELRVPLTFVARMKSGDVNDPLLLQVLPLNAEKQTTENCSVDPLQEKTYNVRPGLIHKYTGRVLLTAAVSCPINCRYCFRRHFPYTENRITQKTWQPALDYIGNDKTIREVILSGGEPLLLNDRTIDSLLSQLENIAHVKLIRIHTRFPIAVPQRLTNVLCNRLIASRCKIALVLHSNHANEINEHVCNSLKPLVSSPVTLLNQTVLLRGINDNANILKNLNEKLYDAGVLPYYLHATDPIAGASHWQVSDTDAQKIARELTDQLPGYLVPTLVREVAGKQSKTRLALSD